MTTITPTAIIPTLRLEGSINASSKKVFEERIIDFCHSSTKNTVMIDMAQVNFVDSSGLMVLVKALRLLESMERRLILSQLQPSVQMIFEITGLENIFYIIEQANPAKRSIAKVA